MIAIYGEGNLTDPHVLVVGQYLSDIDLTDTESEGMEFRIGRGEGEGFFVGMALIEDQGWVLSARLLGPEVRIPYPTFIAMSDYGGGPVLEIDVACRRGSGGGRVTTRSLIIEVLCSDHGYPQPHRSQRTGMCEEGKTVVLMEGQAIRIKTGFVIDVTELIDQVVAGDNIRRSQPA